MEEAIMKHRVEIVSTCIKKLEILTRHYYPKENGGLLYGILTSNSTQIIDVSDAGPNAKRSLSRVIFDNEYLGTYTEECLKHNIYVIGTWHSHPPGNGRFPSPTDLKTMSSLQKFYEPIANSIYCITSIEQDKWAFSLFILEGKMARMIENIVQRKDTAG